MSYYANEHVSKKFKQNIRRLLEKKRWGAASRLYTKVYGTSPNTDILDEDAAKMLEKVICKYIDAYQAAQDRETIARIMELIAKQADRDKDQVVLRGY